MNQIDKQNLLLQRLEDLESRLAFQEITIEELNKTIVQQQIEMLKIQKHFYTITDKMNSIQTSVITVQSEDILPPHY